MKRGFAGLEGRCGGRLAVGGDWCGAGCADAVGVLEVGLPAQETLQLVHTGILVVVDPPVGGVGRIKNDVMT